MSRIMANPFPTGGLFVGSTTHPPATSLRVGSVAHGRTITEVRMLQLAERADETVGLWCLLCVVCLGLGVE